MEYRGRHSMPSLYYSHHVRSEDGPCTLHRMSGDGGDPRRTTAHAAASAATTANGGRAACRHGHQRGSATGYHPGDGKSHHGGLGHRRRTPMPNVLHAYHVRSIDDSHALRCVRFKARTTYHAAAAAAAAAPASGFGHRQYHNHCATRGIYGKFRAVVKCYCHCHNYNNNYHYHHHFQKIATAIPNASNEKQAQVRHRQRRRTRSHRKVTGSDRIHARIPRSA
mmetsp:Transcript_18051/g.37713  ORF Transcript_18051/g.37713 Transcript_18051/m.37713 type:complete len:223 (+) Transcript_18051:592-1260(+)